jgi:hypothetical protein
MTNYGNIDILWLDGSWVKKEVNCKSVKFKEVKPQIKDICIAEIVKRLEENNNV